ncbi:5-amino-6-(5-phosphoribosylamino)uracil reductase [Methylobacterium sp. UNC378MF]|uniref:5-amino-6-(5-phosphoribosylamino)uracil reductase n=1 Tax=Methylobacterium oryzae TaxID=334852 RepID=A0ABU7TLV0_9HYPH|nr:RibD family protein [Methylobacterium sp. UNC378MF]SDA17481.1 5-amino-6-(5-phosphoribosylamino)uracil reductase [Methylobacterium sp. UNC378MF]
MRPRIICHMVASVDGKLHPSRFTVPAAGVDAGRLRKHYDEVSAKFGAQGWMCGRVTMQEISKGKARTVKGPGISSREPFVGDRGDRDLAVAIDPHGKVRYGKDHLLGDHAVAVLSEGVPDAYLAELREDGVSYVFAGPDGRDLAKAMDALGDTFGVETLLLEGGAAINGAFLKAGLLDEISVLIHPAVDGLAGVQTIFEYAGEADERPGAGQALRHVHTETLDGGMVWLRYQVEKAPA